MTLEALLERVRRGDVVEFEETLAAIDDAYRFTPVAFDNGLGARRLHNRAGENTGSCKILALGRLHGLTPVQTLALFGRHYRAVLATPEGEDHGNIRRFMSDGWEGVSFAATPLAPRV